MAPIHVYCPCGQRYTIDEAGLGKKGACKKCGTIASATAS